MTFRRPYSIVLTLIIASTLVTSAIGSVSADPITDFIHPSRDPASAAPTPLNDPWLIPPPGYESRSPGYVLATRPTLVRPILTRAISTQLLVRSTDAKGRPVPIVTTVIVPTAPWTGPGPRPVVAYNMAIDGLGNTCAPSWLMPRGLGPEIAAVQIFLAKNYAVVVADHQGPRQAYAAGAMAGHAVLDSLRGAVDLPVLGLSPHAPIVATGYSGGAIASGWAAQLAPTYAPELNIVGVAFGGTPIDYRLLLHSMNGGIASTLFLSATLGVAREYPEMFSLLNDNGWRLAMLSKDWCTALLAPGGIVAPIPVQALSDIPDAVDNPISQEVLRQTEMGGATPTAPIFIYQGIGDGWIPKQGSEHLYDQWCSRGVSVRLEEYLGEHLIVAATGVPGAYSWLDQRLAGVPAPAGCSSFGR